MTAEAGDLNRSTLSPVRIAISLAVVLVIVGIIYAIESSQRASADSAAIDLASEGPGPSVGAPAPDFVGTTIDGTTYRLSGLEGNAVWINFWASWCPPCRAETPDLQATYDSYRGRGMIFLAISIGESEDAVRSYVETTKVTYPVIVDTDERIAAQYHVNGIPAHFFVDGQGVLRSIYVGTINRNLAADRLNAILSPNSGN